MPVPISERTPAYVEHPGSAWTVGAIRTVLASRKAGGSPASQAQPGASWAEVVEAILLHRVDGLLAAELDALGMPHEYAAPIAARRRIAMQRGMAATRDTAFVSTALALAGVEHLIVKGVVLSATVGEMPALRGAGDIDLWVRPEDVARVELLARSHGWSRRANAAKLPAPDSGLRWRTLLRFAHEQPLGNQQRSTLDLHWRLAQHQPELGFDFDQALRMSQAVPAVGPSVRTLHGDHVLVHVAQHGRKEAWPTLRHVVDVVQLVAKLGSSRVASLARADRNTSLALLIASNLDRSLEILVASGSERVQAHALEAWRGCLSLQRPLHVRRSLTGRKAVEARVRHELWLARSAPDWGTRCAWAMHLAVPLRRALERAPAEGL